MKKFLKIVSFFILMILLLLPISSCANAGFDEDNTPIERGFDTVSGGGNDDGEPTIPSACAFKTDKTVFDINNVYVEFFYGYNLEMPKPIYATTITANVIIIIDNFSEMNYRYVFYQEDPNVIWVRTVEDYLANYDNYSWDWFRTPKFLHSEIVKIPKDAFKSDKGKIGLAFNCWYEETRTKSIISDLMWYGINYQVKGNTLKLSTDSI